MQPCKLSPPNDPRLFPFPIPFYELINFSFNMLWWNVPLGTCLLFGLH